jgi:hypothetical protein
MKIHLAAVLGSFEMFKAFIKRSFLECQFIDFLTALKDVVFPLTYDKNKNSLVRIEELNDYLESSDFANIFKSPIELELEQAVKEKE